MSLLSRLDPNAYAASVLGIGDSIVTWFQSVGLDLTQPFPTEVIWGVAAGSLATLTATFVTIRLLRRDRQNRAQNLLDLAHAANAISANRDYSIRALSNSKDEMGILVDTFNRMIAQVEINDQRMKSAVEQAESAKIAKAKFLATMSHEIRTPINGVLGMTELLLDTPLTPDQKEYGGTIYQSAENLLSIINDILEFSKGEAQSYEFEDMSFSLSALVGECLDTISTVARDKGIELCGFVENSVPDNVRGDPARIRQVLLNLLSNALKFTAEGEVVLKVELATDHGDTVEVRFEVKDTGIGIPKDRIDRLFKSFSQVDASNNRRYGGTGLGLVISKQIVDGMDGTMFVRTAEGKGSIFGFRVELPKEAESIGMLTDAPTGKRILVVDESASARHSLEVMLQGNDLEIVSSGLAGRRLILESEGSKKFDLVLLDVRQAQDFGIGASVELAFPDVPLVLLAPVDRVGVEIASDWRGRTSSMAKPLKRKDLYWCLNDIFEGKPQDSNTLRISKGRATNEQTQLSGDIYVLVAEDHPINHRITTRFLDKLGVTWELAENGEEAVQAVKNYKFDLILMDIQMPVMDGLEATRTIRALEEGTPDRVPIVAMTAAVLEEDRRQCEEAGFDDYLPKPVKLSEIHERIVKWTTSMAAAA